MARVAYVDFSLDPKEVDKMKVLMKGYSFGQKLKPEMIVELATTNIKEMAGLENHLYVHPLNEVLSKDEKFEVVQVLFFVAASDGVVEAIESEEIRTINKGLELSTQHFLAARAQVASYLKSLHRNCLYYSGISFWLFFCMSFMVFFTIGN